MPRQSRSNECTHCSRVRGPDAPAVVCATRGADGVVTGVTFIARDVSEQRATSMELERVSWQDALTLLPNRQSLLLHLKELADDCEEDGIYEFFFSGPPLIISGGTGSPINPQAIK